MRQIDNMTPQEIDTLSLKGMTAPHKALRHHVTGAIERGEAQPIVEQPAPNKAQHSPLPWTWENNGSAGTNIYDERHTAVAMVDAYNPRPAKRSHDNAKLIVRAVNHADKLAEALRELTGMVERYKDAELGREPLASYFNAKDVLDAYEADRA